MADLKHAKDLQPSYDLALSHNGTEKWADNFAVRMIERIDDLERQLAEMTADRNLWKDDHDGDCPYKTQLAEARKFHEASQQGAESFLAQTGYSDSRPHSAPSIARLMQDYADLRLAEAKKLAEWTPITERIPDLHVPVLVVIEGLVFEAERINKTWYENAAGSRRRGVTHWQPLPAPPQPEKEKKA